MDMNPLIVRIRDDGQPLGTGTGLKFSADDLGAFDPEHETALDKLATFICATMDDSGPTPGEWWKSKPWTTVATQRIQEIDLQRAAALKRFE